MPSLRGQGISWVSKETRTSRSLRWATRLHHLRRWWPSSNHMLNHVGILTRWIGPTNFKWMPMCSCDFGLGQIQASISWTAPLEATVPCPRTRLVQVIAKYRCECSTSYPLNLVLLSTLLTVRTSTLQGHHLENLKVAPKSHPSLRWRWLGSVLKVTKQHSLSRVSGWRIALHKLGNKISGALAEEAASGCDLLGIDAGDPLTLWWGAESELGRKKPTSDPWGF